MTPAIFGLSGPVLTDEERAFFHEADPAGYILMGRNIADRVQVLALTDALRAIHGRDKLLISIDQEGGRVQRMKAPEWFAFPPGSVFDALYDVAPASAIEAARANAEALGHDLAEVGITCTHAPVLDVRQPGAHDVIGDRAYGFEPLRVAAIGRAVLEGLGRSGVVGTIKHMPGHGRSSVDSHKDLPRVTSGAAELESDLAPFIALHDAPVGMTGHLVFEAWDPERPATQSPVVIGDIIRGRIGFDGLLLTDDLDMQALSGSVPERAAVSLAAGCDIALNCWGRMDDMEGISDRLPAMTEVTRARLERAHEGIGRTARTADQPELIARRDALLEAAGVAA